MTVRMRPTTPRATPYSISRTGVVSMLSTLRDHTSSRKPSDPARVSCHTRWKRRIPVNRIRTVCSPLP